MLNSTQQTASILVLIGSGLSAVATGFTLLSYYRFECLRNYAFNFCVFFIAMTEFFNSLMYLGVEVYVLSSNQQLEDGPLCDAMGCVTSLLMSGKVAPAILFLSIPLMMRHGYKSSLKYFHVLIVLILVYCIAFTIVAQVKGLFVPSSPDAIWCWIEGHMGREKSTFEQESPQLSSSSMPTTAPPPSLMDSEFIKWSKVFRGLAFIPVIVVTFLAGLYGFLYLLCAHWYKRNFQEGAFCKILTRLTYFIFFLLAWTLLLFNELKPSGKDKYFSYTIDFLTPSFGFFEMVIFWWTEDVLQLWRGKEQRHPLTALLDKWQSKDHAPVKLMRQGMRSTGELQVDREIIEGLIVDHHGDGDSDFASTVSSTTSGSRTLRPKRTPLQ